MTLPARPIEPMERLTSRELELILRCSEPGATQARVAEELGIATSTVKNTLRNAYRTLGVRTLAQAVRIVGSPSGTARLP